MRVKSAVIATLAVVAAVVGFTFSATRSLTQCDKCPASIHDVPPIDNGRDAITADPRASQQSLTRSVTRSPAK